MERRGRKQKIGNVKPIGEMPNGWENMFLGTYKPACQGTAVPYFDKYDNQWKIVLFNTLNPEYLIYEFENKSYNRVIYDDSIQK
jgi:hypothetical protein